MIFLPKSWDFYHCLTGPGDILGPRDETLAGHLLGDRGGSMAVENPMGEKNTIFSMGYPEKQP